MARKNLTVTETGKIVGSEPQTQSPDQLESVINTVVSQSLNNMTEPMRVKSNWIQSGNFQTGVSGWNIDALGNVEFNNGNFRGDITGASGTFSGTLNAATITGGTITGAVIKNQTGTVVIDDTGLNSSNNFTNAYIYDVPAVNTTSSSYVQVSGSSMNSFTISRTTNIFVYANVQAANDGYSQSTPGTTWIAIYKDSTAIFAEAVGADQTVKWSTGSGLIVSTAMRPQTVFIGGLYTFAAGTYVLSLYYKCTQGSSTSNAYINAYDMGYIILGQ